MRLIRGFDNAKGALLSERGLDLESVPLSVKAKIEKVFGEPLSPALVVDKIVTRVREGGDEAVREFSRALDGSAPDLLEVPHDCLACAFEDAPNELANAMSIASDRIRRFHESSMPKNWMDEEAGYGQIFNPIGSIGVYVPGGTAPLASTVLMTVIPARVAGVAEVVLSTPPGPDGLPHQAILAACHMAGVDRVFRIGGAQAVAAMAYGTESVPQVDLVCGPGNIFVTLAKKAVFGDVGIDGLYGPTETMIVADETANPTLCAADLVAQAEHDPMARPILISTSAEVAEAARREAVDRAGRLERRDIASASLRDRGCVIVVEDLGQAVELANLFAPEHLSLMVSHPDQWVSKIRNAGAIFVGDESHEVLGDYVAGPSHVMPVGGTARFSSGLNVHTFLKVSPVIAMRDDETGTLSKAASVLGRAEGLTGHAEAAEIRQEIAST